jgi:osmotically-inducible protein OsmY
MTRKRILAGLNKTDHQGNAMKLYVAMTGLLASSLVGVQAHSAEREGAAKDAWIDGTLEAVYALNRHLSAFAINTEVSDGIVHLTGNVSNDIDRDLAGELAKNVEGVVEVDNVLVVAPDAKGTLADVPAEGTARSFGTWIDDATTTASVKSRLLANANTQGLQIDVDTRGDQVTLTGEVASTQEKALAEELALSTGDVKSVHNQLIVRAPL